MDFDQYLTHANAVTDVLAVIMTWWISFSAIFILLFCVGFNPVGIGAGKDA